MLREVGSSTSLVWAAALTGLVLLAAMAARPRSHAQDPSQTARLFEMRTYIAHDGKLEALHRRFREHTTRLFEKHGMTNIGYWVPAEGDEAANTLIYILAYPNREAREEAWKAFVNDPEWKAAKEASEIDGPLVKSVEVKFLNPTDYSAIR
ncbi:MAG: NIPSNAP family protein [Pirellulales bacterium]|nr:NIPSNAP family protein [Pirellulales bacterium]